MISKELEAQIKLLEDPDKSIYSIIHQSLVNKGEALIPLLEEVWANSLTPLVHSRIEDIIHDINFSKVLEKSEAWVDSGRSDWLEILIIISKFYYQSIDENLLINEFSKIRNDIWLEINDNLTAFEKVQMINHVLFKKHKIFKSSQTANDKSSYFISELLQHKKGNDLSIGMLYQVLCQKLDLPVYGVNLPGNFILAYMSSEQADFTQSEATDVLFYINPLNNGAVFGMQEIDTYLEKNNLKPKSSYYHPVSNVLLLTRYIESLMEVLKQANEFERVKELEQLKKIVSFK